MHSIRPAFVACPRWIRLLGVRDITLISNCILPEYLLKISPSVSQSYFKLWVGFLSHTGILLICDMFVILCPINKYVKHNFPHKFGCEYTDSLLFFFFFLNPLEVWNSKQIGAKLKRRWLLQYENPKAWSFGHAGPLHVPQKIPTDLFSSFIL